MLVSGATARDVKQSNANVVPTALEDFGHQVSTVSSKYPNEITQTLRESLNCHMTCVTNVPVFSEQKLELDCLTQKVLSQHETGLQLIKANNLASR
jgi:hypothetical protein